jgi:hypothetical protein
MARAESNPSTKLSTGLARRAFVTALAGGAAAVIVAPAASLASGENDPIFAAIEAHRRALETTNKILREGARLEETLPKELQQTDLRDLDDPIFETDAPVWIASERAVIAAFEAETDAQLALVSISPTTAGGVRAVLAYAAEAKQTTGCEFSKFEDDDGKSYSFEFFLMRNCAETLANLSIAA